jgi:hypothetical protein
MLKVRLTEAKCFTVEKCRANTLNIMAFWITTLTVKAFT